MQGRIVRVQRERSIPGEDVPSKITVGPFEQVTSAWQTEVRGEVQLIYLDPPFFTGRRFKRRTETDGAAVTVSAYRDVWDSRESYMNTMRQALTQAHELLSDTGTLFLHVDYRVNAHMRLLLDEIFGEDRFVNEIIWTYESGGRAKNFFPRKHDTILFYSKTKSFYFDLTAVPCGTRGDTRENHMKKQTDSDGRTYRAIYSKGKEYRYYDDEPVYPSDVWTDISHLQQRDPERSGYETQKPLKLLKRIIGAASREGDLVADFFAGSGTTGVAAAQLGRRFYLGDMGDPAVLVMDARLSEASTAYCIEAETRMDDAVLKADADVKENGLTVRLTAFELPESGQEKEKHTLTGLRAIDHWSLGFLDGETYIRLTESKNAEQALSARLPAGSRASSAVMIWDYLGNRRCYRLEDAETAMGGH